MTTDVDLLISYFAGAGDIFPMGPTEVSPIPFVDRVEAAARAGFVGFGLHPEDVKAVRQTMSYADMRRVLSANGIRHLEAEFLIDWFETGERRQKSDVVRAELLEIASELGVKDIKIGPGFHTEIADIPQMSDEFGKLCDQAAASGTDVVLEIMPWSNVRRIDTGLAIVSAADRPNGGLLIDIWHMARGGIPYSEIRKIPARFIKAVEIDDAPATPAVADIWEETIHWRNLPGEGDLDVPAFLREVQAAGYRGVYGAEVLSASLRKLPVDEIAKRLFETSRAQFSQL